MPAAYQRLYVNIDHVATIRQARLADEPDPLLAALECERAGADGITAHLREDRRHIQDADIERLATGIGTVLNLEMALAGDMLDLAERIAPRQVTFVPERRQEITTEGGLDMRHDPRRLALAVERLQARGIRCSLFIDPDVEAVAASNAIGVAAIELHTGRYAHHPGDEAPLRALHEAATHAARLGVAVHAGHGLTLRNVGSVANIPEVEELNIGHSIVSRAVFVGLGEAVREMRAAMRHGRGNWPAAVAGT